MTRYLSPEQVCEIIPGMTRRRLQRLRDEGKGPSYSKPTPKTIVYVEDDVHEWVRRSMVSTRDQAD